MKLNKKMLVLVTLGLVGASIANADVITLKDGRNIEGKIKNTESDTVVMDVSGIEMRIPKANIASMDIGTEVVASREAKPTISKPAATKAKTRPLTIPAGTVITVRLSEGVNTRNGVKGQKFTAVLESSLKVGDVLVVERGAMVYGLISELTTARRLAGSASMSLQLTHVLIDNKMEAISTEALSAQGANTAGDTVKKTARAAAIGGLIDGSDGAKTGAKVGVGAAILTKGKDIEAPKGAIFDFHLTAPFTH